MSHSPKNVADNKKSNASYPNRDEPVTAARFVRATNQPIVGSDEDRFSGPPGAGNTRQNPNVSERAVKKDSEDSKRQWPLADLAPSSDDSEMSDLSYEEIDSENSEDKDYCDGLLDELDKINCAPVDLKKQALREASQSKTTFQRQLQKQDEKIMRLTEKNEKLEDNLGDAREQICSLERQLEVLNAQGATIQTMMRLMEKQSEDFKTMKSAWQENQKAFDFGMTMSDKFCALVEEEKKWNTEHQRLLSLVEEQKKEGGEKEQKIRYLVDILQEKVDEAKKVEAKKEVKEEDYKSMRIRQLEAALCAREEQVKMLHEDLRSAEGRCLRKDQAIKELEQKSSDLLTQKKDLDDKWRMKMEESKAEIERLEKTAHGYKQQADEIRVLMEEISMGAGEKKDEKELTHEKEMVGSSIDRSASALTVKDNALKNAEEKVRSQTRSLQWQADRSQSERIGGPRRAVYPPARGGYTGRGGYTARGGHSASRGYTARRGYTAHPDRTGFWFNPRHHGAFATGRGGRGAGYI